MKKYGWLYYVVTGVVLVAIVALLVINIFQSNSHYNANVTSIAEIQVEQQKLQADLATANGQITTLSGQLTTLNSSLTSMNTEVTSLNSDLTSARTQLSQLSASASNLASQISTVQSSASSTASQVTNIQSSITTLQSNINSLSSTVTSLQSTINSLTARVTTLESTVSAPLNLLSSYSVTQGANTATIIIASFTPSYAGYLYVSGTSSSATGFIRVYNNTLAGGTDYLIGTGAAITATLTAGYSYTIYFGNTDTVSVYASISAQYYRS